MMLVYFGYLISRFELLRIKCLQIKLLSKVEKEQILNKIIFKSVLISFLNQAFYQFLKGTLIPDAAVWRYAGNLDFIITVVVPEDLDIYMQLNSTDEIEM